MLESLEKHMSKEKWFFVISCTQAIASLLVWAIFEGSPSFGLDCAMEVARIGALCSILSEWFNRDGS